MFLGKNRKLGRNLEEISVGEKLVLTEKMEDKDLLLYLGLTNDANPLYIQHDYASQTEFKKPIVPTVMLTGMITSAISKYLPGPGSHIFSQNLEFLKPVYHYETIEFLLEIIEVNKDQHTLTVQVRVLNEEEQTVVKGNLRVQPPGMLQTKDK
ncbi:MaoC/PaaZ C-terminal domain-containing protein [Lederbergia galactosidilytica]|uniref:Enoyl-CoA hydratase n=1 Tax=Lederbergia galactosidilytica TaxID=217031 RepID=A0A177ZJQ9_9BACI|nr:MaoC/PaaZ C-terminal domain-containing protein [Lederbergia galactosidilytica]OAK68221.1 enoyl-CoA hydratase [Lederbergia galactosidilytica]